MALTIRSLLDGRDRPVVAKPNDPLGEAIEQMLRHDYSQLPVVNDQDCLHGIVTSDSILRTVDAFGLQPSELTVADATIKTRSFDPDGDIAELLDGLRDQYAAVIVDGEGKILGVVTNFDASEYFRRRAEDMMLVEDIEMTIREHVLSAYAGHGGETDTGKLTAAIAKTAGVDRTVKERIRQFVAKYNELKGQRAVSDEDDFIERAFEAVYGNPKAKEFNGLTLANYVDLLLHPSIWPMYEDVFRIEAKALRRLLNDVRTTRNALAHFRREISATNRTKLRFCAGWLERHPPRKIARDEAPPTVVTTKQSEVAAEIVSMAPVQEEPESGEGRYAKLAVWLQEQSSRDIILAFSGVEDVIGAKLPSSARAHRAWWANDSVSHPQSKLWLEVGWRVAHVDLASELVLFSRTKDREAAYVRFFNTVAALLEKRAAFPFKRYTPTGVNWHNFYRLPPEKSGAVLVCSFARGGRLRVQLYIDTQVTERNKAIFDGLLAQRVQIERAIGELVSWERLDSRRACRLAVYREGTITAPENTWPAMADLGREPASAFPRRSRWHVRRALAEASKT
jgi:CBS domain-containing protein